MAIVNNCLSTGAQTNGLNKKIDLVNGAYTQLRISGLTVDPGPEEIRVALERLENLAAEWEDAKNMCFGYFFENNPDPNTPHNLERAFWHCFETNLAVRLIPDYNKQVPPELMAQARQSVCSSLAKLKSAQLQQTQYSPRQARGSGNTLRYNQYQNYYRQQDNAPYTCELISLTVGDVDDYEENYTDYVRAGETISSYTIEAGKGLTLVSTSLANNRISFRVKADSVDGNTNPDRLNLEFKVKTSLGRENTRYRPVEVFQPADLQTGSTINYP